MGPDKTEYPDSFQHKWDDRSESLTTSSGYLVYRALTAFSVEIRPHPLLMLPPAESTLIPHYVFPPPDPRQHHSLGDSCIDFGISLCPLHIFPTSYSLIAKLPSTVETEIISRARRTRGKTSPREPGKDHLLAHQDSRNNPRRGCINSNLTNCSESAVIVQAGEGKIRPGNYHYNRNRGICSCSQRRKSVQHAGLELPLGSTSTERGFLL